MLLTPQLTVRISSDLIVADAVRAKHRHEEDSFWYWKSFLYLVLLSIVWLQNCGIAGFTDARDVFATASLELPIKQIDKQSPIKWQSVLSEYLTSAYFRYF